MSPAGAPSTVPALLRAATASDPGRPRLTWYGADGERVELSARVLTNWVAKTANLLVEELLDPPAPGEAPVVLLDLPVHWRSAVWGLAAWTVGARVVLARPHVPPGAVVVTSAPATAPPTDPAGPPLVVVALPALAFSAPDVPAGALDHNAVVAGYGDELPVGVEPFVLDAGPAPSSDPGSVPPRLLVEAATTPLPEVLLTLARALAADGSVVLRGAGAPDAAHLAAVERTTG